MTSPIPPASNMMTLICQVFGDDDPFVIDISGDKFVGQLKDEIRKTQYVTLKDTWGNKLKLWKWNKPDDEMNDSELGDQSQLSASKTLNQVFGTGTLNPDFIHIIIKADSKCPVFTFLWISC